MEAKSNTDTDIDLGRGLRRKKLTHFAENNGMKTLFSNIF